jgi:hypothetical protein
MNELLDPNRTVDPADSLDVGLAAGCGRTPEGKPNLCCSIRCG